MTRALCIALIFSFILSAAPALANPTGGEVVAGDATIVQESNTKLGIIQNTDKAIINWQQFNIDAGEHTQFYQPSASSIALNRVISDNPSSILGKLSANGHIILVNQNGILVGPDAIIDVHSFTATTHDIRNDDFMKGILKFTTPGRPDASIVNQGRVTLADTGIGAFVAPSVKNSGVIVAKLGKVALASAEGFTLDLYGDNLVKLLVDKETLKDAMTISGGEVVPLVLNDGTIKADGGYVLLKAEAARGAVNAVINNSGIIEAKTASQKNGEIILSGGDDSLVSVSGTLDATGSASGGGRIEVTGGQVSIATDATVDASGDLGGGTILIGGDYLGGTADDVTYAALGITREDMVIPTAKFVTIESGAHIAADARIQGDGGKVVAWADTATFAHGTISALGGTASGNGGFIEVSGKTYLNIDDLEVNAAATNGKGGTVLFDPGDVYIVSPASASASYDVTDFTSTAAVGTRTNISSSDVETILNRGTNAVIRATAEGPNVDSSGNVYVTDNIRKTSGDDARLSLFAADEVHVRSNVEIVSTSGELEFYVDADYDRHSYGLVNLEAGSVIRTNGGAVLLNGSTFRKNGTIDTTSSSGGSSGAVATRHDYFEVTDFSFLQTGEEPIQKQSSSLDGWEVSASASKSKKKNSLTKRDPDNKNGWDTSASIGVEASKSGKATFKSAGFEVGGDGENYGLGGEASFGEAKGTVSAGLLLDKDGLNASVGVVGEADIVELDGRGRLGNDAYHADADGELSLGEVTAGAEGKLTASKKGLAAQGEIGAEANLVEVEGGLRGGFTIPFTKVKIELGIGGEAGIGAQAQAKGEAQFTSEGVKLGGQAGLGLGPSLGLNFDFNIGWSWLRLYVRVQG